MTDPFLVDPSAVVSSSTPVPSSSSSPTHDEHSPSRTPRHALSYSSASSDDEDGVFFGAHDPHETDFVAKLSAVRSPDPTPSLQRRQSATRIVRLRKRDSREFLRRKTLLISVKDNVDEEFEPLDSPKDKASPRERSVPEGAQAVACSVPQASPSSPQSPSRLPGPNSAAPGGDFDFLCASEEDEPESPSELGDDHDAASFDESSIGSDDEGGDHDSESDSDKENVVVTGNGAADDDDLELGPEQDPTVTLGMGALTIAESEDALPGLDLGGLSLDDFADPDVTPAVQIIAVDTDYGTESDDLSLSGTESVDGDLQADKLDIIYERDNRDGDEIATVLSTISVSSEPLDCGSSCSSLLADPEEFCSPGSPDHAQDPVIWEEEDSIEIARGGLVVIPHISHFSAPIRAETGSPFRALPSLPLSPAAFAEDSQELPPSMSASPTVRLPSVDSPTPGSPSKSPAFRRPPIASPSATIPVNVPSISATPASKSATAPPENRTNKVLKPLVSSVAKKPADKAVVAARVMSIRGQLDAVVATKMSGMGPPQRTVSSSSTISSSTSASVRSKPKPTVPKPPTMMRPEGHRKPVVPRVGNAHASASSTAPRHGTADSRSLKPTIPRPHAFTRPVGKPIANARSGVVPNASAPSATKSVGGPHSSGGRPPLAARPAAAPPLSMRPVMNGPGHLQPRSLAASATSSTFLKTRPISPIQQPVNPLKRPFSVNQTTAPRPMLSVGVGAAIRPTLGLPARVVRDASGAANFQTFSMASTREFSVAAMVAGTPLGKSPARARRPFLEGSSRGTPSSTRILKLGTPSRAAGTPRRFATASLSATSPTKSGAVAIDSADTEADPPAHHTRSSEEPNVEPSSSLPQGAAGHRGSSEDHEDVSFQLGAAPSSTPPTSPPSASSSHSSSPSQSSKTHAPKRSSPKRDADASPPSKLVRPRRASKPAAPPTQAQARIRPPQTVVPSIAPNMSEKELKTATQRNTMRNQVYHCAIDRQIVRKPGPRPPSPTSKIRTTFDKNEEERKHARGDRAKRRAQESDGGAGNETQDELEPVVRIERPRGPGDDPDYKTPARPAKRAKVDKQGPSDKYVSWDSSLILIRDDGEGRLGSAAPQTQGAKEEPAKSCIRQGSKVSLDQHGNVVETARPKEDLKRARIVVTAVFYDGEEPLPAAYPSSTTTGTSGAGKGKKKA